jgi:hypothetical protein
MVKQLKGWRKCATVFAGLSAGLSASSLEAQITQVDYNALTGTQLVSFNSVAGGTGAGTNYDELLIVGGVGFGEHFSGQTVTPFGNFDQLSGAPSEGLTLLPGDEGQNLTVFQSPAGAVLSGNGPQGWPIFDAIGEGAISLLFSTDQSEFGFRLAGGNAGNAYVSFFGGDGSLIQTMTLSALPVVASYGFSRDGAVHDIRGVSIWNDDVTGFGLANIRFNVASAVPEPATWAMMLMGFGAAGYSMRRRRRQNGGLPQLA